MDADRREAFDDLLRGMRAGRMTRRTFLWRMGALGVGAATAIGLMEACGARHTIFIVWRSEHDATGAYRRLATAFNAQNRDNIHVTYVLGSPNSGELYGDYVSMLQPASGSTDLLSLDVTWTVPFAANGWLYALDERWTPNARAAYLQVPFQACSYAGHVYAAPYRIDAGMLYYRTDLVAHPPTTWEDLTTLATPFQRHARGPDGRDGFIWSGQPGEALTCLFTEVLASYGGSVFQPGDPYATAIDSDAARQALATMAGWVGTASPPAVLTYGDNDTLTRWFEGDAVFLRNWASAHPQPGSLNAAAVLGRYAAVPALSSAASSAGGHSCLGGWQLGINAYSNAPDACWQFIQYLLTPAAQKQAALIGDIAPTATSVYADAEVRAEHPFFAEALPAFQRAQARPASPLYPQITQIIQQHVELVIAGESNPNTALTAMRSDLEVIAEHATPLPNAPHGPILL